MKTTAITILISVFWFCAVQSSAQVRFSAIDTHLPFAEAISEIELIPLSDDDVNMLRTEIWCKHGNCPVPEFKMHSQGPELIVADDSYILVDPTQDRIYRYARDGRFLNTIGSIDEGKEFIRNAQLIGDELYVYIYPGTARRYRLDGTLEESTDIGDIGQGGWTVKEGVLAWYGFGSGRPGRLALWNGNDSTSFLPTSAKVFNLSLALPVFSSNGMDVTFIDATNSNVMRYRKGKVNRHLDIDLGEFEIDRSYYEYDDPMQAGMAMMSKPFGLVRRFEADGKNGFTEVFLQTPEGKVSEYYGIFLKDRWIWFSPGTINEHPFVNSFRTVKKKTLYCILNPDIIGNMQEELRAKISKPLEETPDDFIIAKIYLK